MNRAALIAVLIALCLCGAVGDLDARVINLRESLHLAVGDTIPAKTVMDSIKAATRGDELVCDSLVVGEGIHFGRVGIAKVRCVLSFRGARFRGGVNFERVIFQGRGYFKEATFQGWATFSGTTFQDGVNFERVTFQGEANFSSVMFQGWANFFRATFQGRAGFRGATFQGEAGFEITMFQEAAHFHRATFQEPANFYEATFREAASFWRATFQQPISFWGATFQGAADFREATFQEGCRFLRARFRENASLEGRVLHTFDLRESTFEKSVDLREADLDSARIFLSDIDFRRVLVRWPQLKGQIFFVQGDSSITEDVAKTEDVATVYTALENNFRNLGQHEDEDDCYYHRKSIERKHAFRDMTWHPKTWLSPLIVHPALWLTCGYGVKPEFAILAGAVLILIFAFFYYQLGAIQERKRDFPTQAHTHAGPRGYTLLGTTDDSRTRWQRFRDALYFSVNTFTTVGYGDWYPTAERLKVRLWRWTLTIPLLRFRMLAMMEGLIGWLLLALFLVTLGKKWIR